MNYSTNLWIEKYRPTTLDDIVLSREDRIFFEALKEKQEIPHLLYSGTAGVGKTSLAKIIINDILQCDYLYINASDENGIDTIRGKIMGFAQTKSFDGKIKVILLDEADSITMEGMKALRNTMEEYSGTCRFQLTCNYLHRIILPIQSRCQIINLVPPIEGVVQRVSEILKKENIVVNPTQKPLLLEHIRKNLPDLRRIVNDIQKFSVTGTLNIKNEDSSSFAKSIVAKILCKEDMMKLRKEVIEGEKFFSSDYRHLMKLIFEEVFNSELNYELKGDLLLAAADSMESDSFVVDKEINFFAALLRMSRLMEVYQK
jgi:DNA polymerase III delta prime subunit